MKSTEKPWPDPERLDPFNPVDIVLTAERGKVPWIYSQIPDQCGHGIGWDDECEKCDDIWRLDQIKTLTKLAAKYGLRLVPL
jgi:hypothetical protein